MQVRVTKERLTQASGIKNLIFFKNPIREFKNLKKQIIFAPANEH